MSKQRTVELVIDPKEKDLGEFTVRRALPDKRRRRIGPFVFFDHMGPAEFSPGTGVNVRSHPHIGLATITYLFEGEILHRDSLGYVQPIRPGAVNWMTAGRGIVHSEKVTPEIFASGQKLHGIQTWVALPLESEEMEPGFQHYPEELIPSTTVDGVDVTVIIGSAYGVNSPVVTESDTLYVEVNMDAGQSIELPSADELGIYVVDGKVSIGDDDIDARQLAVVEGSEGGTVSAHAASKLMLCGGDSLEGERHVWWNFVSSSRERLEQAKNDWRDGNFGEVPGEPDYIPLPEI
ncbi:MAG: pirin family protein [Woeseiaceae bacterium]|nr:pirin family protein [Woeseiaceae bacterium]